MHSEKRQIQMLPDNMSDLAGFLCTHEVELHRTVPSRNYMSRRCQNGARCIGSKGAAWACSADLGEIRQDICARCVTRSRRSRVSRTDRQCDSTESTSCRTSRRPLKLNNNKVSKKWHCALIGHSSCRRKRQQVRRNQVPPSVTCLHLLALLDMSRCLKFF